MLVHDMRPGFEIFALPLLFWAALSGIAAGRLELQPPACGAAAGELIEAASACGYRQPHNATLTPDRRHLVFAEVQRDRLVVLDAETLTYVDQIGEDDLKWPHDLSFAADGTLYVADSGRDRIAIFKRSPGNGKYRLAGELRGGFRNPEGVVAHPDGTIYVTGEDSGTVVAFRDGVEVATARGLAQPHGIDVTRDGVIVVVESGRDRIVTFASGLDHGEVRRLLGSSLAEPRSVMALPDDGVMVTDKARSLVRIFDAGGRFVRSFGTGKVGFGPDAFNAPEGIASFGGRIWITDTGNGRIVRISDAWRPS